MYAIIRHQMPCFSPSSCCQKTLPYKKDLLFSHHYMLSVMFSKMLRMLLYHAIPVFRSMAKKRDCPESLEYMNETEFVFLGEPMPYVALNSKP